jgi:hypothetical protein
MTPDEVVTPDDLLTLLAEATRLLPGSNAAALRLLLLRSKWWWQCHHCGEVHRHDVTWCAACGAIPLRRRKGQQALWDVDEVVHRVLVDNPSA